MTEQTRFDRMWRRYDSTVRRVDAEALQMLRRALPAGRVVRWQHGDRWRSAVVMEVLGFQYHGADVRVKSLVSGKEYRIAAYSILVALPP